MRRIVPRRDLTSEQIDLAVVLGVVPPLLSEFVVEWQFPLMHLARDLNPHALRRPQAKNKLCSDKEFMDCLLSQQPVPFRQSVRDAETIFKMSRQSTDV